ncbi:MAG: PPC domain-containing protein [Longimicrobiaceae bacterium]
MFSYRFHRPPLLRVLVLAALASACGGGDGPTGGGGKKVYDVGQVVTGTLANAAEVHTLRVRSSAAGDAAVFLQATGGAVQASLTTEAGAVLAAVTAAAAGREEPSAVVHLEAGTVYRLLVSAASGSAGGGYRVRVDSVGNAPERVPAELPVDAVVEGERLESPADVDDFTFTGAAGELYIAFLQAAPGGGALRATVPHPGFSGATLTLVDSHGGDAALETQSTGRFELPASGTYHLKVSALPGAAASPGDYRLQLRRVGMGPESRPAALPANDTVAGEAIDYVGDIDEFTLTGTPGDRYNLFFRAEPASASGTLWLEAASVPTGADVRRAPSNGSQVLLDNATGSITLPASGSYRVRVYGNSDRALDRGAYRIFAHRVDPQPEHAPAVLALNDSVVGERIDLPGDADEFTLDLAQQTVVVLSLSVEGDWRGTGVLPARVELESTFAGSERRDAGTHPITLAAGHHTVRVGGAWDEGVGVRGGYRLRVFAIDPAPEHLPASFAVGDTVAGEDLRPLGDRDVFTFQAAAGQELNLFLQGTGGTADGGMYAIVSTLSDGYLRAVLSSFAAPSLRTNATRFTIPTTGTYKVTVYPNNGGYVYADQGAYRFAVVPASRAPEHVSATVAVGSTVTGESLDYPSDIDAFTVHGTPGSTMRIALQMATNNPFVALVAQDAATNQFLGSYSTAAGVPQQDTFTVPASGTVRLMVLEGFYCSPTGSCDFVQTGPYTFSVQ